MSFNAEKKVMAQIKDKKKQLEGAKQIHDVVKKVRAVIQELEMYKNIRDISNSKVQNIAKNSQSKHVKMIEESNKIDELKAKEKEAFENFRKLKDKVKEKIAEINKLGDNLKEINKKLGIEKSEQRKIKQARDQQSLVEKQKLVEEKMAKGEKLTTDDLLVMQSK